MEHQIWILNKPADFFFEPRASFFFVYFWLRNI